MDVTANQNMYQGITAYMTKFTEGDYKILDFIFPKTTISFVPTSHDNDSSDHTKVDNPEIWEQNLLYSQAPEMFPVNTPKDYLTPHITKTKVKGVELYKVYIPVVSHDRGRLEVAANAVYRLLDKQFGDTLIHVKTMSVGPNDYDFCGGKLETVLPTRLVVVPS